MVSGRAYSTTTLDVVKAALAADPTDDLVQDVVLLLRRLPQQDRLLLVSLAAGVPLSMLKRFYSTNVYVKVRRALASFEELLKEYREQGL